MLVCEADSLLPRIEKRGWYFLSIPNYQGCSQFKFYFYPKAGHLGVFHGQWGGQTPPLGRSHNKTIKDIYKNKC